MSDISTLAPMAYDRGESPLDYAEHQVEILTRHFLTPWQAAS